MNTGSTDAGTKKPTKTKIPTAKHTKNTEKPIDKPTKA